MFSKIVIDNWRQYFHIDIDFHERLTVLTGANGAGKTTLFQLLNRHWGWNHQFVSTPRFSKEGVRKYWTGFWGKDAEEHDAEPQQAQRQIGLIQYSSGHQTAMSVPENANETFDVQIHNRQELFGVYVPSHRPPYLYQKVEQIPTTLDAKEQIFQVYLLEQMNRFNVNHRTQSPAFRIKSSLMSLATFGYGNKAVKANDDAIKTYEGYQEILKTILPKSLGFQRLSVQVPDISLETSSGTFSFDAVSGGVAALIDVSWQIYMYSLLHKEFVVVIDEPEAHLHPALQQRLLPDLLKAFPNVQFIIATHNPFIVTSVRESNVYVLDYDESRRVCSTKLDMVNKAGSANEILRDVLGVPFTVPIWVDERLDELIREFGGHEVTEQSLTRLRDQMQEFGLAHLFPDALGRVLERTR